MLRDTSQLVHFTGERTNVKPPIGSVDDDGMSQGETLPSNRPAQANEEFDRPGQRAKACLAATPCCVAHR